LRAAGLLNFGIGRVSRKEAKMQKIRKEQHHPIAAAIE
jgi:hypothetical protein